MLAVKVKPTGNKILLAVKLDVILLLALAVGTGAVTSVLVSGKKSYRIF